MSSQSIGGYAGKLLRVDLTNEIFTEERLDEQTLRKYVGGAGLGAMRASQRIGGDAPNFAIHTKKGNTPRGYDHRAHWTEMFDKVTSNTGTLESRPTGHMGVGEVLSPEEVVSAATSGKGRMSFVDTLGVCFFQR